MKLSIIIPAHNEEKVIKSTIMRVAKDLRGRNFEIVIVNDNSSDGTAKIIDSLARRMKNVRPVHKLADEPGPKGMGSALIMGFSKARGDVLIPFMGDLSDDPKDILKMEKKIEEGYDVVVGSRFMKGGSTENYPSMKMVANRAWNNIFAFLFGMKVKDISNAFKAYRAFVIKKVKPRSKGFDITAEIVLKARIAGFKISEVPVSWSERKKSQGVSKFGSFSLKFVFTKLPRIGYSYGSLAFRLWIEYLSQRVRRLGKR
jgi:glycosyltransferase involved in cell wall biosynthesis